MVDKCQVVHYEIIPSSHRNNRVLHPNKYNQGTTPEMGASDRQLHWWYRAREQGADRILPDWILMRNQVMMK